MRLGTTLGIGASTGGKEGARVSCDQAKKRKTTRKDAGGICRRSSYLLLFQLAAHRFGSKCLPSGPPRPSLLHGLVDSRFFVSASQPNQYMR